MKQALHLFHAVLVGLCIFFTLPGIAQAQQKFTISGYVTDAESGEKIIAANVYDNLTRLGAVTNDYGFFSLTLKEGPVTLISSFSGYKSFQTNFVLSRDTVLTIGLALYTLETVEIVAEEEERIEQKTEMSTIDVPIQQIKKLPALLGEVDVVKAIQLLPGVQSGSEGSTGLYVRGGGPDQNLILLDGVPLYYVSHLGGFFSVFNADALSSVKLIKGGFPARYGGRLSSVLDIRMQEGNLNKFQGEGSIGLISSKLSLQGPIIKGKTSYIVSGRRTYFDLFSRPITKYASKGNSSFGYYFHDLNAKVNHIFSEKDRLYFSFYLGDDNLDLKEKFSNGSKGSAEYSSNTFRNKVGWGNDLAALRWNHIWSPRLFSNLTATYSKYQMGIRYDEENEYMQNDTLRSSSSFFEYVSGIRDYGIKLDFDYYPAPAHDVKFGINTTFHKFTPGSLGYRENSGSTKIDTTLKTKIHNTVETSAYLEDNFQIGSRISVNAGVHLVNYLVSEESMFSIQPRVSARVQLMDNLSFKASYVQMTQFIHLLTNSTIGLPIDLWVPATDKVPSQHSWQAAGGLATTLWDDMLEVSLEGYYKQMDGLIAFKEGTNFFLGGLSEGSWENIVETGGQGEAYGAELLVQKKKGKTTGWIGYTLSWNYRQFDALNGGVKFPDRYDRRHDLSVVVSHTFNERVSVSGTWVFGTGNAITLPSGNYATLEHWDFGDGVTGSFVPMSISSALWGDFSARLYENGRNGFRMEPYHRLDLGVNLSKKTKWGERTWNFGVYNAYNRQNPFAYYIREEYNSSNNTYTPKLKKLSLFPIIPSVSYSFKF
ncbi:MAG: TonB-dependent receptor [Bacteroidia bacterium]